MSSGDIGSIIDSLTFDSSYVWGLNRVVKVANNIYATAYPRGNTSYGQTGWVVTFQVNDDGTIEDSIIDSLQIENTSYCDEVDIIHITGNIYAAAYRSTATDNGWIKTFTIDSAGNIGAATIDSLQFETGYANTPSIVHIDGIYYAIAYQGPDNDGWLKTVSINGVGTILAVDSLEFDTANGNSPHIISVGNGYYAIAYLGASGNGYVCTVTIDSSSGDIGASVIDTFQFSSISTQRSPRLVQVYNDIYAVALYRGDGTNIKTFTISNIDGSIGDAVIDSMVFDSIGGDIGGATPDIIKLQDSSIYAVPYRGTNGHGRVRTLTIDNTGIISDTTIDLLIFEPSYCYIPRIIQVTDTGVCLVVYGHGSGEVNGTAVTFQVSVPFTTTIMSDAHTIAPETSTIYSSALIVAKHPWVTDFKAIPYDPGVLLSWVAGYGANSSTDLDKCKVTLQYSTDGFNYAILNTPPYVVRDLVQYQGTPNVIYQSDLIDGARYYYSLFIFYEDTQLWYGPYYPTPQGVVPTIKLTSPFASGSLSFSKLGTNTKINPLHEITTDVIIWLPSNRSGSAKAIEDTLNLVKPAHVKLNILYEHYYVAHTTSAQFNTCTFNSGSYAVSKGTIKNKIATINSSFDGRPKILGG